MIDFKALKQSVGIEEVAQNFLHLSLKPHEDTLRGPCPVCESNNPRALIVTPEKGLWYCFTKKSGGDLISLVAHVQKTSQRQAAEVLANVYMVEIPEAKPVAAQETPPNAQNGVLAPLTYLEPIHPLLDTLGIPQNVAEAVGIGYASKGMMRGTVAVPVRTPSGALIGYIGITEAKTPKAWRFP